MYKVRLNGREVDLNDLPSRTDEILESGQAPGFRMPSFWGNENGGKGRRFADKNTPYFQDQSEFNAWADKKYGKNQWSTTPVDQIADDAVNNKTVYESKEKKLTDYL